MPTKAWPILPKRRRTVVAAVAILSSFCISGTARSCNIELLVKNSTPFTITGVTYFDVDAGRWSHNLLSHDLNSSDSERIRWQGAGDYKLHITQSNDMDNPRSALATDICAKSQIVVNEDGLVVR